MTTGHSFPSKKGWIRSFAPATIANFGSGFDTFAAALCAIEPRGRSRTIRAPLGDCVSVRRTKTPGVRVVSIEGDGGRLPKRASLNCASAAASAVLKAHRARFGLDLVLEKGLPLSSGLGSSAASAAAGAFAASLAIDRGAITGKTALLAPALDGEHVADGAWHGDNVWASLMGGGLIVLSNRPPEIVAVETPRSLTWAIVHPDFELSTRRSRAVLPRRVELADAVHQAARFAAFVRAWQTGDREGIGAGLEDRLAVPRRARLVPGFEAVRRAVMRAGGHGMTLAGAGPSILIVTSEGRERSVGEAAREAFQRAGLSSTLLVCAVDVGGARQVRDT